MGIIKENKSLIIYFTPGENYVYAPGYLDQLYIYIVIIIIHIIMFEMHNLKVIFVDFCSDSPKVEM